MLAIHIMDALGKYSGLPDINILQNLQSWIKGVGSGYESFPNATEHFVVKSLSS